VGKILNGCRIASCSSYRIDGSEELITSIFRVGSQPRKKLERSRWLDTWQTHQFAVRLISTLKMVVMRSYVISVNQRTIRRSIPEDDIIHNCCCCENTKVSHIIRLFLQISVVGVQYKYGYCLRKWNTQIDRQTDITFTFSFTLWTDCNGSRTINKFIQRDAPLYRCVAVLSLYWKKPQVPKRKICVAVALCPDPSWIQYLFLGLREYQATRMAKWQGNENKRKRIQLRSWYMILRQKARS
jgi:hypothetical protein